MTARDLQPPAFVRHLLAWVLPPGVDGLTILGDLIEGFHEEAERRGPAAAKAWFRWQAIRLIGRFVFNADRPIRLIAQTASDVRLACRSGFRQPASSAVVALTVGAAVAANTALFSVFDGLLFRPLPFRDADRIVHVQTDAVGRAEGRRAILEESIQRARTTASFSERADAMPALLFDWAGPAVNEWKLRPFRLSASMFQLLGVRPILGRAFTDQDMSGSSSAVLLGYDLWKTRYGGDTAIIDRLIEIPGTPGEPRWRVAGVMPEGFAFPAGANFWVPLSSRMASSPVQSLARLAPGVSIEQIRAELPHITVTPLREHLRPDGAYALGVLLIGTALLLLVAWVQVASLLLARATSRVAEIGLRLALGGGRGRLVRQFAAEGAVLVGCAVGIAALATPLLISLIVGVLPPETTLGQSVAPDARAFVFAGALAAVGLVVLTVLPIDLVRRSSPIGLLRGGLLGTLQVRTTRVRSALFVAQLAIATALVYLTGLTFRSFVEVTTVNLGYDTSDLYAIKMPRGDWLATNSRERLERQRVLVSETLTSLGQLPGVAHASGSHSWPMERDGFDSLALTPQADVSKAPIMGRFGVITTGYPAALGVPIVEGREPTFSEREQVKNHADIGFGLVNRSLARELERFGPVVGQLVRGQGLFRVTGVIADVVIDRSDRPVEPTLFVYLPNFAVVSVALVRLERGASLEQTGVPVALSRLWGPNAPKPFPVADAVRLAAGDHRARTSLLALVAAMTVPLTMVGVAGALGYATRQRTREFGIRLAMGAEPQELARQVSKSALVASSIAIAAGLAMGTATGWLMSTSLFAVTPVDPATIAASAVLIVIVAWLSAILPARRAGRISPAEALRES